MQTFDIEPETCLRVSAKTGLGLETVLPAVIEQVPCPEGRPEGPLRMLLFDAFHDEYRYWYHVKGSTYKPQIVVLCEELYTNPTCTCIVHLQTLCLLG